MDSVEYVEYVDDISDQECYDNTTIETDIKPKSKPKKEEKPITIDFRPPPPKHIAKCPRDLKSLTL
jgi:hypothetical protein